MFSVFRMGPAACGRRLCDIGRVLLRVIKRVKNGRSWHGEIDCMAITIKNETAKLSVYFGRARTSQFSDT